MTPRAVTSCIITLISLLFFGLSPTYAQLSPPAWWETSPTTIIDSQATENNHAPVNLGQLKHVAAMARAHLDDELAGVGGAGAEIDALVNGFDSETAANFSPINLGQLKAVAKPFYDRLIYLGYDTRENLQDRGYGIGWSGFFPWDPSTPKSENYAPANTGQLKMVFSFDLSGFNPCAAPADDYGIPDVWKESYFGHANDHAYDDPSGNGYPLLYEYHYGTDPTDPESLPPIYYTVDRSLTANETTVFHDIKPAVEQAKTDGVDYRVIEVGPGIYEGSDNYGVTTTGVKLLLIAREGPEQTIVEGTGAASNPAIEILSESAVVGFLFRDFDAAFVEVSDVEGGLLANCRFGGHPNYNTIGISIERSSFSLRDSVFLTGGAVSVDNFEWPEVDHLLRVVNSRFENHHTSALNVLAGRLHVRDSHFEGNQASSGAAVFLNSVTDANIENTLFTGNHATGSGGAISFDGLELKLLNSDFLDNTAGDDGGAVYGSGSSTLATENSFFSGNRAESSSARGGAVYWSSSEATISDSRFVDNEASEGGALYLTLGIQKVANSIFLGNRADARGGAISAQVAFEKSFLLVNSTLVGNELLSEDPMASLEGSGAYVLLDWQSEGTILNSILWNEGSSLLINSSAGGVVDVNHSNIGPETNAYSGANDNLNVEPMLRPDGLLLAESPMIDAGTFTGAPVYDIHGETRQSPDVAIGADEFVDTDGEGMPDWWQVHYFTSLGQDKDADPDGDNLSNLQEYAVATDPTDPDSNGDGVMDGDSPYDDHNWDGIPSWLAVLLGLDPYEADNSGNLVSNFEALAFGADPFDAAEIPSQSLLPHDSQNPPVITLHEPTNAIQL